MPAPIVFGSMHASGSNIMLFKSCRTSNGWSASVSLQWTSNSKPSSSWCPVSKYRIPRIVRRTTLKILSRSTFDASRTSNINPDRTHCSRISRKNDARRPSAFGFSRDRMIASMLRFASGCALASSERQTFCRKYSSSLEVEQWHISQAGTVIKFAGRGFGNRVFWGNVIVGQMLARTAVRTLFGSNHVESSRSSKTALSFPS